MYDYTIIGAGIVGTLIARKLSAYPVQTLILDKENDIANVQTSANSAIIHSGHDPRPGTLKARLCVEGNALYDDLEKELHIPLRRTGGLVVAHDKAEIKALEDMLERAKMNGVKGARILTTHQVHQIEPHLNQSIIRALSLPSTKVTFPWEVAIRALQNAIHNGVTFKKNANVSTIHYQDYIFQITLEDGTVIHTKNVINASGVHADNIAHMLEKNVPYRITPKRGEYFVLDRQVEHFIEHVIYPLPTVRGKGVLITPQTHGNILLGPTSELKDDKDRHETTRSGLAYVKSQVKNLCDHMPYQYMIRSFAGVRASSTHGDFYIQASSAYQGFYHVAGIDSPGLTAAPAIANYLVEEIIKLNLPIKKNFDPYIKPVTPFHQLSFAAQQDMAKKNPRYGHIICQCEHVTEQEIIDAIHSDVGSDTMKGIKKRTRAGSGTCQMGYCQSHILKIIARETNQKMNDINYDAQDTKILGEETKVGS